MGLEGDSNSQLFLNRGLSGRLKMEFSFGMGLEISMTAGSGIQA